MKYHPDKHHRRSIRLNGYDYSQNGAYFVTICSNNHEIMFGNVNDGEMELNVAGNLIHIWWNSLMEKYPNIELDEYIIMPNHIHGIVMVGADRRVCPDNYNNRNDGKTGKHTGSHEGFKILNSQIQDEEYN
jgi:hypothetical protein